MQKQQQKQSDSENPYLVPLRGLNEYVYCPRLFHLMYVQGLFEESIDTVEGRLQHQKRLARSKAGKSMPADEEPATPWPENLLREMTLTSEELGITGKCDVILETSGELVPVEVKHGGPPEGATPFQIGEWTVDAGIWPNDQIQLAGQIALLNSAGHHCSRGRLYYQKTKSLLDLVPDSSLLSALHWTIAQARNAADLPMPDPLLDSAKCIRCSLNHICLPDETHQLLGRINEPRQLYPGRDDCGIMHVITPGTHIGKHGEAIKVHIPDSPESLVPIKDVAHLCCWGNVQVTTQALLALADRGISISWMTSGGWLRAITSAPLEKNVELRRMQYRHCDKESTRLQLARWIVAAKIENQRVLIRRNADSAAAQGALQTMQECRKKSVQAESIDSLRGIEGYAAKAYWDIFPSMLTPRDNNQLPMHGRNRRPPKDPVNALLSFGYSMLLRDFMTALHGAGMDPLNGFYHSIVPGRPALALDLMEAFRPLIVDSALLRSVNEGSFTNEDFIQLPGSCIIREHAKKRWIQAYERRVDEMVTHPVFGYRLSYRRIFTLEARLLGRFFIGEIQEYHPITTK